MEEHPSASIATCGVKLVITTTMCGCTTGKGSPAFAVAHLSSVSLLVSAVHTFARTARNSLRSEKRLLAMYGPPCKVAKCDVNRGWNLRWLAALKRQREGHIAAAVARLWVEGQIGRASCRER